MIVFSAVPDETGLLDLDTVKAELGISDEDGDDILERYIATRSLEIARYCGRDPVQQFAAGSAVETFDLPRHHRTVVAHHKPLWLYHWPVTAIASITENGTALTAADYQLDATRKLWRMDADGNHIHWPVGKIIVAYTGGYDLPADCPADLGDYCMRLVNLSWSTRARDPSLRSMEVMGVQAERYDLPASAASSIRDEIESVLNNYKNDFF